MTTLNMHGAISKSRSKKKREMVMLNCEDCHRPTKLVPEMFAHGAKVVCRECWEIREGAEQ